MLPHGKYAAVTWSIPSNFGGMTKAMLERSASFCRYGGVAVDVLTFDWRSSYNGVREELSSTLPPGVRILNFWEELAAIEDRSEEHTSELQSRFDLVCRLLLEKKKVKRSNI